MAKSRQTNNPDSSSIQDRVVAFAEQVGWIAGLAKAKTEDWADRTQLTDQLTKIRDGASDLLTRLSQSGEAAAPPSPPKRAVSASDRTIHASGKQHRAPQAKQRGVKHSHQEIAKAKMSSTLRRRGRG